MPDVRLVSDLRSLTGSDLTTGTLARTNGYASVNDLSGAAYRYDAAATADDDGGSVLRPDGVAASSPGRWLLVHDGRINVRWFGARGDYGSDNPLNDDSAAILAARRFVTGLRKVLPGGDGNGTGLATLYFPAGVYVVTVPGTLMDSAVGLRTAGITYEGTGESTILYRPAEDSSLPLFDIEDSYLFIYVQGLVFSADSASATFWKSRSSGGTQSARFERCGWYGEWGNVFDLVGTNNNSEFGWTNFSVAGTIGCFFHVGNTDTSDQFLNYWFERGSVNITSGRFLDMARGGSISVRDVDFSGTGFASTDVVTLFSLRNQGHDSGVCRFLVDGCRFELKVPQAKFLYSEWGGGSIVLRGLDFSSSAPYADAQNLTAEFVWGNQGGPQVHWEDCQISGRHAYTVGAEAWHSVGRVDYAKCDLLQHRDVATFVTLIDSGSYGLGGLPSVRFDRCRLGGVSYPASNRTYAASTSYALGDVVMVGWSSYTCVQAGTTGTTAPFFGAGAGISDYGVKWDWVDTFRTFWLADCVYPPRTMGAVAERKTASFIGVNGEAPGDEGERIEMVLPPRAVVTKVRLFAPSLANGGVSEYAHVRFSVKSGSGTVFFDHTSDGVYSAGLTDAGFIWEGVYQAGDDVPSRWLAFTREDTAGQHGGKTLCYVEYV